MFKKILSLGSAVTSKSDTSTKKSSASKQSTSVSATQLPSLPANFADEVFNLELEVEQQELDIEHITRLLELYAIGIEYYESIKSDKYQIFKNKTKNLLLKQSVNNAMDRKAEELKTEPNESLETDLKKGKVELDVDSGEIGKKYRQKELELNVKYIQQQDTKESVQSLLDTHSQDIRQNNKIIQHDTDKQKNLILQRLKQRKVKREGTLTTEENEFIPSQVNQESPNKKRQGRNSVDLLGTNDFGMDIVDITSTGVASQGCVKTEPNVSWNFRDSDLLNFNDIATGSSSGQGQNYSYEMMIQNQMGMRNGFNSHANAVYESPQKGQAQQLPPIKEEAQKQQTSASKKEKVRVSKKQVMEFQMQNSVIPF